MNKLKRIKKNGFTLVELIIVIAIIAVLAVAAFMMLTKWLSKSRDSRRLSDLGTIERGLQVGYSDVDDGINMYPTVKDQTGAVSLLSGGEVIGYQGIVDMEVVKGASMQKVPLDPSDQSEYTYLVSQNRQKFQLLAFLEDETEVSVLNNTYALEYANMIPTTKGFELGVLLRQNDNMPANLIDGVTEVEFSSATQYKAIVNNETVKEGADIINAPIVKEEVVVNSEPALTPQEACEAKSDHTWDGINCNYNYRASCKEIYTAGESTGNKTYSIDPDGAGGVAPFTAYCDMTNGGWTFVVGINGGDNTHINTNAVTPENLTSTSGYGKYSDSVINLLVTDTIKLVCGGVETTYTSDCIFSSTSEATGACSNVDSNPPHYGVAEWEAINVVTKGVYANPGTNGCFNGPSGLNQWGQSGSLWVK